MFPMKRKNADLLDAAITEGLEALKNETLGSDEYNRTLAGVAELYALKDKQSKSVVSPDTVALIAANLIGILAIIGHERAHVITTKAFGLLTRLR